MNAIIEKFYQCVSKLEANQINQKKMEKPIMKSHFITNQIKDLERLIVVIMTKPTIYVRSWHKTHPTKFFNQSHIFPAEKLQKMIDAGEFWECIKKSDVQSDRIRAKLKLEEINKMLKINAPTFCEAAKAIAKFSAAYTATIGDVQMEVWKHRKDATK